MGVGVARCRSVTQLLHSRVCQWEDVEPSLPGPQQSGTWRVILRWWEQWRQQWECGRCWGGGGTDGDGPVPRQRLPRGEPAADGLFLSLARRRMAESTERTYWDGNRQRYDAAQEQAEHTTGNLYREKSRWQAVTCVLAATMLLSAVTVYGIARKLQPITETRYIVINEASQVRVLAWEGYTPESGVVQKEIGEWLHC